MTADEVLLKKPEPKKKSYLQGEPLPLERQTTFGRIKSWWDGLRIKPYVDIKDLNNPAGDDDGRTPRPAVEAGIKISF